MRPAGFSLLCLTLAGSLAAQSNPTAQAPKTSARITEIIRASLPGYAPALPAPATGTADAAPEDPDVLVLPKFMVKEKRVPTGDPDVWLNPRIVQQKAMVAYKDSMTPLEWAMNCWFVPILSAPPSVRARAAYEEHKLSEAYRQLAHIAEVGRLADPVTAAQLKKAVSDMQAADDWQSRPAGK